MFCAHRASARVALSSPACPRRPKPRRAARTSLHKIIHDCFRILALRDAGGVRLYTRNGNDFNARFPLVMAAVATLSTRSSLIDGEAIVRDDNGFAVFALLHSWPTNLSAVLCSFDLLELDGEDLRRLTIEVRKAGLAQLLRAPHPAIALNDLRRRRRYRLSAGLQARLRRPCRSGSARCIAPAAPNTGTRSRTRRRRQSGARRRKNGVKSGADRHAMPQDYCHKCSIGPIHSVAGAPNDFVSAGGLHRRA